jgi:hypothetical protein
VFIKKWRSASRQKQAQQWPTLTRILPNPQHPPVGVSHHPHPSRQRVLTSVIGALAPRELCHGYCPSTSYSEGWASLWLKARKGAPLNLTGDCKGMVRGPASHTSLLIPWVPPIVHGMLSIMGYSPPRLPSTSLTASGNRVHRSVKLVRLAGLYSQEAKPTHPLIHDWGSS